MAMVWRIRLVTVEEAERGLGTWEPIGLFTDPEGETFVVAKAQFDTADEDAKSTEKSGSLGGDW